MLGGLFALVLAGEAAATEGELSSATPVSPAVVETLDAAAVGSETVDAAVEDAAAQPPAVTDAAPSVPAPETPAAPEIPPAQPPVAAEVPAPAPSADPTPRAADHGPQPERRSRVRRQRGPGAQSVTDTRGGGESAGGDSSTRDGGDASAEPGAPAESDGATAESPSLAGDAAAADHGDSGSGADATTAGAGSTADAPADAGAEHPVAAAAAPAGASDEPSPPVTVAPAPEAGPPIAGPAEAAVAASERVSAGPRLHVPLPGFPSFGVAPPAGPLDAPAAAGFGFATAEASTPVVGYLTGAAPGSTTRPSAAGRGRADKPARSHRVAVAHAPHAPFAPPNGNLHAASSATSGGGAAQDVWCALILCLAIFAAQELRRHRVRFGFSSPAGFTLATERPG